MFPINASITLSVIVTASIPMWTVSGDKNYWSEGVDWIFAGNATPSTNQCTTLICTSLLKPDCSQMNCSDQSPDAATILTNPHHNKSKLTAHPLPTPEVKHKTLPNFYALEPSPNNKASSIAKDFQWKEVMISWRVMP